MKLQSGNWPALIRGLPGAEGLFLGRLTGKLMQVVDRKSQFLNLWSFS